MKLEPLKSKSKAQGGRPSRYRDTLSEEIINALEYGMRQDQILNALGTSLSELSKFAKKTDEMNEAYELLLGKRNKEFSDSIELSPIDAEETYEEQIDKGEVEAVRTLRLILRTGTSDSAKVQAAKELLDRKRGKPVQTTHINQQTTYTIIAQIPAAPNSVSAQADAIETDYEVIEE
jgi:hypothetical protein